MDPNSPKVDGFSGLRALDALPMWNGSQFSPVEVPKKLLDALDNPQNEIPTVHVAGTNGKGSVCSDIAACLWASGASVGQFISPHLCAVNERCMINGSPVSLDDFDRSVQIVVDTALELKLETSYFVVTMIATFLQFVEKQIDWAVVEVGLGGTFDATNLIEKPKASVITRIALDHTHLLGETLAEIAENKAGIIKPNVPVFVGANEPEAIEVCRASAEKVGAPVHCFAKDFHLNADYSELPLFRQENRALAKAVVEHLGIEEGAIKRGFAVARWPGRAEHLLATNKKGAEVEVLLDGMHNPNGANAVVQYLKQYLSDHNSIEKLVVVFAIRVTKQWQDVVEILSGSLSETVLSTKWICTGKTIPYAVDPAEFVELLPQATIVDDEAQALDEALFESDGRSLVLVLGSLYLIGAVRPLLCDQPVQTIEKSTE